jgi:hypothetical protein
VVNFIRDIVETTQVQAVNFVRDVMDWPSVNPPSPFFLILPVFLGHRVADEKVPWTLEVKQLEQ